MLILLNKVALTYEQIYLHPNTGVMICKICRVCYLQSH